MQRMDSRGGGNFGRGTFKARGSREVVVAVVEQIIEQ
jgi:hypothetical protein